MDSWKLFYEILWATGERYGAVRQLKVEDVFESNKKPLSHITYRSTTRKRSAGKNAKTRQVWIADGLKTQLMAFDIPNSVYLFPGRDSSKPISASACEKQFKHYLKLSGLEHKGHSLHSFRRSFVTRAARLGFGIKVIQTMTGHLDTRSVIPYIENDEFIIRNAMEAIA